MAIEFAIISSLFILGCIATLEFGRALHVRGEISYAADVAERVILMDPEVPNSAVQSAVRSAFRGNANLMTIELGEETVDGVKFRTLVVSYPFSLLVPFLSTKEVGLSVDRRTPIG